MSNERGTPREHIIKAIDALSAHPQVYDTRSSSLYKSKPMGPQDQPDFINAVVALKTDLTPDDLLELCHKLEHDAQRVRQRRWGERSLDVDILLYGDKQISSPTLTIPHPGVTLRNFVLIPLVELNPSLKIKGTLAKNLPMSQDWTGLQLIN